MPAFRTPQSLTEAIYRKQPERVELMLAQGEDPNLPAPRYRSDRGRPTLPLTEAVSQGDQAVVDRLLKAGSDPNGRPWLASPISRAIAGQRLDLLKTLKAAGADLDRYHAEGGVYTSYMEEACAVGSPATVDWLIEQGGDVRSTRNEGFTLVHTPLFNGMSERDKQVIKILRDRGADLLAFAVNKDNGEQYHPVSYAAAFGDREVMGWFLDAGANPNQFRDHMINGAGGADGEKLPILATALLGKSKDKDGVCRALIERGARLDVAIDFNTHTIGPCVTLAQKWEDLPAPIGRIHGADYLMLACAWSDAGCVRALLEHGMDANALSTNAMTPILAWVARLSSNEMLDDLDKLQALLEHGANPNAADAQGITAMHHLARYGDRWATVDAREQQWVLNLIDLLLSHGADLSLRNCAGKTPVDVAWYEEQSNGVHDRLVVHQQHAALNEHTRTAPTRARARL